MMGAPGVGRTRNEAPAKNPLVAFWSLGTSAVQSLMNKLVDEREQGRLQGAVSSLNSLGGVFAPFAFAALVAAAIAPTVRVNLPGAAYLLAGALVGLGGLLAWRITRPGAVD